MIIHLCSSNAAKLREFALAARETSFEVRELPGLQRLEPPEENGLTFEENATHKAIYYSRFTEQIVLADDSGLEVDALNGAPGVLSARYAGLAATDQDNNNLLLRELASADRRTARFVSVVALAKQSSLLVTARGTVEGEILTAPRGTGGFGYDPLFFYAPFQRSFGELTDPEKLSVSARGQALRKAFAQLNSRD